LTSALEGGEGLDSRPGRNITKGCINNKVYLKKNGVKGHRLVYIKNQRDATWQYVY